MSQDPRSPKRARTAVSCEDASEQAGVSLKRSDEFWIEDGNIVLVAGETAFRVYRGLLALQSTVFGDLFASSSPSAEERFDDCPVIRLTDSPQDLAHLLRALLPTSRASLYRSKGDPPLSLHKISAIIRLTHKYHIENLLSQALSALKDTFPSSFNKFEDVHWDFPIDISAPGSIAVVNLARLTETYPVLPPALYVCCMLGPALIDGFEREDGTIEYLPATDLKRCIGARDSRTPNYCLEALRSTLARVLELDAVADAAVLDPWIPFIRESGLHEDASGYCVPCQRELLERDIRERRRIWNRLPQIFDVEVPNWNQDLEKGGEEGEENAGGH